MGLGLMLEESVQKYPERVALIANDHRITYRQLNSSVNALGHHLRSLGIRKGDKVAIMLPNCPEFVMAYFAAQKLGAVAVTLNTMSTAYELRYLLQNSDARVCITTAVAAKRFEEIKAELPLCRHLLVTDGEGGGESFKAILDRGPFSIDSEKVGAHDPAAMIYTAGLTGKTLGAVLTHRNLLTQSDLLTVMLQGTEEDRALAIIPYFHAFGAVANMLAIIRTGASVVVMERFTLDSIFAAIAKEKVTYVAAVPRLFLGMILQEGADKYDTRSLRVCITGGSAMPPEFIPVFQNKFNVKLMEGYGLTEAAPISSFSRPNKVQKLGSIGTLIPEAEARIVDDEGTDLPTGKVGELLIKGPNVMLGYYKDEAGTAEVIRDGWLYTGDLAFIDEEGYLFLAGRKKRMVITSGFNVYPQEVEEVLNRHPDVAASRVESKPDLIRGEIVKAFVVTKDGRGADEKDIMRHCRTYLSSYKLPREIEFVAHLND